MSDIMSRDDKGRHYGMQNDRKNWGKMGGFVTKRALSKCKKPVVCIFILVCSILTELCSPFLANLDGDWTCRPMITSQVCLS
jgi:hypothetical protein